MKYSLLTVTAVVFAGIASAIAIEPREERLALTYKYFSDIDCTKNVFEDLNVRGKVGAIFTRYPGALPEAPKCILLNSSSTRDLACKVFGYGDMINVKMGDGLYIKMPVGHTGFECTSF
jgi:hypothetical protein